MSYWKFCNIHDCTVSLNEPVMIQNQIVDFLRCCHVKHIRWALPMILNYPLIIILTSQFYKQKCNVQKFHIIDCWTKLSSFFYFQCNDSHLYDSHMPPATTNIDGTMHFDLCSRRSSCIGTFTFCKNQTDTHRDFIRCFLSNSAARIEHALHTTLNNARGPTLPHAREGKNVCAMPTVICRLADGASSPIMQSSAPPRGESMPL